MSMKSWLKLMLVASTATVLAACGSDDDDAAPATRPGTLAEVATGAGFNALVAAADKAGLVAALSDPAADLTVFAPTDAAFDSLAVALGFANANAMVSAVDGPTLAKILSYHVLPGNESAADLVAGGATQATLFSLTPGTPTTLALDTTSGVKLTDAALNQASVVSADVAASNGVIHVIDKVLVPPGVLNLVQMAQSNPVFSVLVEAVVSANLGGALSGSTDLTVFAPTNEAFSKALAELSITKEQLLASPNLAAILSYHVVAGEVRAADVVALPKPAAVPTLLPGKSFSVDASLTITDGNARTAMLVATDVIASNGVIHVIDKVLLPAP
jgi:transforming growth factor-beta-induced protein